MLRITCNTGCACFALSWNYHQCKDLCYHKSPFQKSTTWMLLQPCLVTSNNLLVWRNFDLLKGLVKSIMCFIFQSTCSESKLLFSDAKSWLNEKSLLRAKPAAAFCRKTHQTWLECDTDQRPGKQNPLMMFFSVLSRLPLEIRYHIIKHLHQL